VLNSASVARVRDALIRAGVDAEIVELPGAARTAQAAADFIGCKPGQIANSLVFRAQASDRALLVMSSGANRVDTARLSALVGESVGKADADFVRRHTGFVIGGVAPVGHTGEVRKFVDRALAVHELIWAAAGHPHTIFRLTYAELLRITGAAAVDVAAARS
jgi:prolyl-tRNA editing enzyme YbaK/EbsC (Cys-tRNA(Pro) deacylase)